LQTTKSQRNHITLGKAIAPLWNEPLTSGS
jgi:hypothetical protein